MLLLRAVVVGMVLIPGVVAAAEHHVTVDGTPEGDGTLAAPWDLATAFAHPPAVQPGDTITLHGGTYPVIGTLEGALFGTADARIVVRAATAERVTLDTGDSSANRIAIVGAFTRYQGFEVMSSAENRWAEPGLEPERGFSIDVYGSEGIQLVNLVVHDTGSAVGFWSAAIGEPEVYGCLIYFNGYDSDDRGHGHGIYSQNEAGPKYLRDNIIFGQYSHGVHAYTEGGMIDEFVIEGNIAFENGVVSTISGRTRNILVGGGPVALMPAGRDNVCWFDRAASEGTSLDFGYGSGTSDPILERNVLVGGGTALRIDAPAATIESNTIVGPSDGADATSHPGNAWFPDSVPTDPFVAVRPNAHDPDRAHVVVVNWAQAASVDVDLSPALDPGDTFVLLDAQDYYGVPVLEGTFDGDPVAVPMDTESVSQVIGEPATPYLHTSAELGAFVLMRTGFDPGGAESTGDDAGESTGVVDDTSGPSSTTVPADTGGSETPTDDGDGTGEGSGGSSDSPSGCTCRSTPPTDALWVLLLGSFMRRRQDHRVRRGLLGGRGGSASRGSGAGRHTSP